MSAYEQLPIFKAALDLARYFDDITCHFDKRHKYGIGIDLCDLSRKALILVAFANKQDHRVEKLQEAVQVLEELKIQIHLCKEIRAFRGKSYEVSVRKVSGLLKQCEGWKNARISQGPKPLG